MSRLRALVEVRAEDPTVRRRARVLVRVGVAMICIGFGLVPVLMLASVTGARLGAVVCTAIGLLSTVVVALARAGRTTAASMAVITIFTAAFVIPTVINDEANVHPIFTVVLVLFAGLTMPRRAMPAVLVFAVLFSFGLPWATQAAVTVVPYHDMVVYTTFTAIVGGLLAVTNSMVIERAFADAADERARAEALAADLLAANTELEQRVAERTGELQAALARAQALSRQLSDISVRDHLTGLHNRRLLDAELTTMLALPDAHPVSVAVADLDGFKCVNDRYGHEVGDTVLRRVATALAADRGEGEVVARLGGEEFVLLSPRTPPQAALARSEQARVRVASLSFDDVVPGLRVTISIGVVTAWELTDDAALLREADRLLYEAKRTGKDRVVAGVLGSGVRVS